ncbi:hypothetical protein [Nesterenkonia ebinurensis]|uniref:hypothetical protein n=1 Tax=Nesterenkonia ebinurensis TaxID=2608252 RepID=UPI00123E1A87|nr:hypothetical protein [Nesterenkonia ebinurensis]
MASGPLSDVIGLTLYESVPLELAVFTGIIRTIAFIAGPMPAYRAAEKDPIVALRYEKAPRWEERHPVVIPSQP